MCQLYDFSYAVPLLSQRRRRTAATLASASSTVTVVKAEGMRVESATDSQDGLSSEAVTQPSRPGSPADHAPHVPLWALSSFHASPFLTHAFVGIVEREAELAAGKEARA
eukprot:EG_transcript_30996